MGIKVKGINHIGIASKDPEKTKEFFDLVLGLPFVGEEVVETQKTATIIFDSCDSGSKEDVSKLEILKSTSDDGPVAKYLEKKGGGIHHIALTVENVEESIAFLLEKGIQMVDESAKNGVCNTKIAFVHPRSTGGILVELVENL